METSTVRAWLSRQLRQSMIPSRREKTDVKSKPSGSGVRAWSQLSCAHSPDVQSSPIIPPSPALRSLTIRARSSSSSECAAPGASIGLPSVTMLSTRSGRRAAMPRASSPPRLWPTMLTLRSRLIAMVSMRRSRVSEAAWVHPTLACIVER